MVSSNQLKGVNNLATTKNITMKQFNGTDYDTLYPKTKVEQVEGAYTQQQILADSTKTLYGLGTDAVPDDVLALIKPMIDSKYSELSSLANSKAKTVAGSYVGTGNNTYKRTLNCGFNPKLVIIVPSSGFTIVNSQLGRTAVLVQGLSTASIYANNHINISWPTNGVSFAGQSSESSGMGMNESRVTYLWVAIG